MRRSFVLAALALVAILAGALEVEGAATRKPRLRSAPKPVELVWHVETLDGQTVSSHLGDQPINPASVVKVATTLWALERLGPDLRFETRVFARGAFNRQTGTVEGDLIVQGTGDPDFQPENAFLVAQALNRLGLTQVRGALIVTRNFWIGWEGGSARTEIDPVKRGLMMAARLRNALDSTRWDRATRKTWREFAERRGLDRRKPPRVQVRGGIGIDGQNRLGELLVVHRSEPLAAALRRFTCFSNNDIERVGMNLGTPDEMAETIGRRFDAPPDAVEFETLSGLGTNRLSPRLIVRLLRELRRSAEQMGMRIEALLPVGGCDPGTVTRFFPGLSEEPNSTSVVAKTGTLIETDGGVAVLAGFANTAQGELVFCVAVPHARSKQHFARLAEERWALDLLAAHGGARPRACAPMLASPDADATVVTVAAK